MKPQKPLPTISLLLVIAMKSAEPMLRVLFFENHGDKVRATAEGVHAKGHGGAEGRKKNGEDRL